MNKNLAKQYYEREEIQRAILSFAKNREIGTRYDGFFGKRPDMMELITDVKALVKKGIFSFHMSEERWENPLLIGNDNLSEDDKNKNRVGWDLILDLDGNDILHSKIVAKLIMDFLKDLGVRNYSIKFSGNKGFHIGVPFEAFSKEIIGIGETRLLFPEAARRIASYIIHEIQRDISKSILEAEGSIEKIAKKYDIDINELVSDKEELYHLNYMKLIEIDTILISTRHLFRMPYSLNEKSGLVSIPIKAQSIMDFEKRWASPRNIKPEFNKNFEFLSYNSKYGKDADILLIKAYEDDYIEMISDSILSSKSSTDFEVTFDQEIEIKDFPQTIQYILSSDFEDGKKRALFVLMTYLGSIKWDIKSIEVLVDEWNNRQSKKLKKNYISAQFTWFRNQSKKISPPNFDNEAYYEGIGIPKDVIDKDRKAFKKREVKNPLHHTILLMSKSKKGSKKK